MSKKNKVSAADPKAATSTTSISPLDVAKEIVYGPRHDDYGHPADNHGRTAALWSAYLGTKVTSRQVCMMNVLQKVSRDANKSGHDHLVDIAGYAENAHMIAKHEEDDRRFAEQKNQFDDGTAKVDPVVVERVKLLERALRGVLPKTAQWVTPDMRSKRWWKGKAERKRRHGTRR